MEKQRAKALIGIAAIAIFASMGAPSLANAAVQGEVRSETVGFADLNLSSPAGVQALYTRIQSAAREVCGPPALRGIELSAAIWRDCVSTSVHDAVLRVKNPALSTYYAERLRATAFKRVS